jgi:fatty-acyl-CoA synthase
VLAPNGLALLAAHFAVPLAGGVLVAINTRLAADEIDYILADSEARVLLVDPELAHLVDVSRVPTVVTDTQAFLADQPLEAPWPDPLEDDPIAINYTSGTTGRPKGVVYSHRGAYLNALSVAFEARLGPDSVYLWTLPMFHCNGWSYTWGAVAAAATHVLLRRIDPAQVWSVIEQERVTHFCAAPTVLIALANDPARPISRPISTGVRAITGGAPPSPTTIAELSALGVEVVHLYGMTETYGPSLSCAWWPEWNDLPAGEQAVLKARQGVPPVAVAGARIVDEAMVDVPADGVSMGELVIRSNTVMRGYYRDQDATEHAFRGGWFHTGDLGVMHPDGYVELRDRAKDVIISGGENISTIQVEQVILGHPDVLEAAVIGVPDDRWGEVPKAFVTLKPGRSLAPEDLIAFCRDRLAHFKAPKHVEIRDLPKTSTGKIQKYVLREEAWAGRDRRIN